MARFRCSACGKEGEIEYRPGKRRCPLCGADNVQVAVSIMELPNDDPLWKQLRGLANDPSDED
jgi:rubredoxin